VAYLPAQLFIPRTIRILFDQHKIIEKSAWQHEKWATIGTFALLLSLAHLTVTNC
jgi:hypothetical protein